MLANISTVFFETIHGVKQMRVNARDVAHLVYDFKTKVASPFKEDFSFTFGGETVHYTGFKIREQGHKDFTLEYSVN